MRMHRITQREFETTLSACSFGQQRLWLLEQLDPGNRAYDLVMAYRLTGDLNAEVLDTSFAEIVRRHEVLRTTLELAGERLAQRVHPAPDRVLTHIDCSLGSPDRRERDALRHIREHLGHHFDLRRGPLFRPLLVRLRQREHILCVAVHHAVFDGWSWAILWREVSALYDACLHGEPSALIEPEVQYVDYAAWQAEQVRQGALDHQLSYWREQLRDPLPDLRLPTDRPRPRIQTSRGARTSSLLALSLCDQLKALAKRHGATLFMTLAATFGTLLHRYTDDDDILIGFPIAGRTCLETEKLIGFFVNTLVLRNSITGGLRFTDVVAQCRDTALGAYANPDLPFDKLVEELEPERSLSRTPVFQVMLVLQNMEKTAPQLTGITVTPIDIDIATTKFDLTLEFSEETSALNATAEYSTDLFDGSTITRMLGHLQVLLNGILANPAERISRLPLLTDSERRRVVSVWNETACDYPRDRTLPQLFEEQVARTPHAVALRDGARRVTFGELNALANRLAHDLHERGLGRGTFIGVCLYRSIEMTVAVLGILKAGGAYLPLDPAHPVTRLRFMVQNANVPLLLTHERTDAVAVALPVPTLRLDSESTVVATERPYTLSAGAVAEDPAYLMYTSGSTGLPKGIVSPHRATVNRLFWMWNAYPFAPGEIACQKTSPSFVDSVWEMFGPLLQGVPSVVVPEDTVRDVSELIQHLARHGVTRIVLVPSLLRSILDHAEGRLQALLPALNFWVSSGEVLPAGLVARFRDALPDGRLLNLYGSTEVAADATCYELPRTDSGRVPVGRPIDNLRVYILDRERQPVPIGIVGRVHVAGTGLAVGYWNSPELTAERFVPDPFDNAPDARMYDTGDLGRYLADGTIELCGRVDDQLKLRGVRIAPGEIEARLREHPAVTDAVIAVRCDDADRQRLVAYVAATAAVSTDDLRDFATTVLPSAMVPAGFVVLPELPRTPHGKVDRDALPRPEWAEMVPRATRITPRTPMERQIATIWADVLTIDDVGIEDNFFDLGGHSLMAMQVASRMWRHFGVDLPVRLLFEHPTIQDLAEALTRSGFSAQAEEAALQPSAAAAGEQPCN